MDGVVDPLPLLFEITEPSLINSPATANISSGCGKFCWRAPSLDYNLEILVVLVFELSLI